MRLNSPQINLITRACMKASRSLIRDFGELENLQVSSKGPGDFVSSADKRTEKIIIEEYNLSDTSDPFDLSEYDLDSLFVLDQSANTFSLYVPVDIFGGSMADITFKLELKIDISDGEHEAMEILNILIKIKRFLSKYKW